MGTPTYAERGITNKGIGGIISGQSRQKQRLIKQISRSFDKSDINLKKQAREDVNQTRQLWTQLITQQWLSDQHRHIYIRYYLIFYSMWGGGESTLDEDQLFWKIVELEEKYQAYQQEKARQILEEQEYQEFLRAIESIRNQATKEGLQRVARIHPARIKSSIFVTSGGLYEIYQILAPYVSAVLDFVPIVGQIKGIAEATIGRDLITLEELPLWQRGIGGMLSFIPFAKGTFSVVKTGLRLSVRVSKKGIYRLAALAYKVSDKIEPRQIYQITKQAANISEDSLRIASKIPSNRTLTTIEKNAVIDIFNGLIQETKTGSRVAQEVRSASKQTGKQSLNRMTEDRLGELVKESARTEPVKLAAKAGAKIESGLLKKEFRPEAIEALQRAGVKVHKGTKLYKQLQSAGKVTLDFINSFYQSPGFKEFVLNWAKGGNSQEGARFIMKYCLAKLKDVPIRFEWPAGIRTIGEKISGETWARYVDIVIDGGTKVNPGSTIYKEFKSWTLETLKKTPSNIRFQLIRDTALFSPKNIRWVFDKSKISEKAVLDAFVTIISKDPYLKKVWGGTETEIRKSLSKVIEMF